jgi:hypothetical protein
VAKEPFARDALNTLLALVGIISLYLSSIYLILHRHAVAGALFAVTLLVTATMYFTWYKHLPPREPAAAETAAGVEGSDVIGGGGGDAALVAEPGR